jgi:hypothetical protein
MIEKLTPEDEKLFFDYLYLKLKNKQLHKDNYDFIILCYKERKESYMLLTFLLNFRFYIFLKENEERIINVFKKLRK